MQETNRSTNLINDEYLNTISNNPLINKQKIISKVEHYINNYQSEDYQNYKNGKLTNKIYQRINKRYNMIKGNDTIELFDRKTDKVIVKIKEPKYIIVSKSLEDLRESENILKHDLDIEYNELKNNINNRENKSIKLKVKEFEEMKNEYIQILENIEIYKLYYLMINKINVNETENIKKSIITEHFGSDTQLIEKKSYNIPNELIDNHYILQGEKIDKYNELKQLMNNNKFNKDDIKKFIEFNKKISSEYNNNIEKYINNDNKINYIVAKLPKIISN